MGVGWGRVEGPPEDPRFPPSFPHGVVCPPAGAAQQGGAEAARRGGPRQAAVSGDLGEGGGWWLAGRRAALGAEGWGTGGGERSEIISSVWERLPLC